jgi:hypothetical protein
VIEIEDPHLLETSNRRGDGVSGNAVGFGNVLYLKDLVDPKPRCLHLDESQDLFFHLLGKGPGLPGIQRQTVILLRVHTQNLWVDKPYALCIMATDA